jgi:glucose/arabinose dehydrogenase
MRSRRDNPFTDSARPEIWAYGLPNPWRFAFDRLTGDLYIGDVG